MKLQLSQLSGLSHKIGQLVGVKVLYTCLCELIIAIQVLRMISTYLFTIIMEFRIFVIMLNVFFYLRQNLYMHKYL